MIEQTRDCSSLTAYNTDTLVEPEGFILRVKQQGAYLVKMEMLKCQIVE